jgi:hypothetical protein
MKPLWPRLFSPLLHRCSFCGQERICLAEAADGYAPGAALEVSESASLELKEGERLGVIGLGAVIVPIITVAVVLTRGWSWW